MTITIVVPTLNEAAVLPNTLARLTKLGFDQLIIVDGGSLDHTRDSVQRFVPTTREERHRARPPAVALEPDPAPIILITTPGRARQMNRGAAASRDDVLLFLHADTQLPQNARTAIEGALADPACVGGRFDVRFEPDRGWSWLIGRMMNIRSRWSGIATGDQAIFVRRSVFEQLGGYADIPLMEDVDFTKRLQRMGRVAALHETVVASFRRWEACGPIRTIVLMWLLRFLFWIGVNPHRLSRFYGAVR